MAELIGVESPEPLPPSARRRTSWRHAPGVAALVVLAVSAFLFITRSPPAPNLERLPASTRGALYQRVLADLELCATAAGEDFGDHCHHQAELAQHFPECDAACRELASRWVRQPTR